MPLVKDDQHLKAPNEEGPVELSEEERRQAAANEYVGQYTFVSIDDVLNWSYCIDATICEQK